MCEGNTSANAKPQWWWWWQQYNSSDDGNDYADDKEMRHDIDTAISIQCGNIGNWINEWQPVRERAQPSKEKLYHLQDNGRRRYYFPFDKELSFLFLYSFFLLIFLFFYKYDEEFLRIKMLVWLAFHLQPQPQLPSPFIWIGSNHFLSICCQRYWRFWLHLCCANIKFYAVCVIRGICSPPQRILNCIYFLI